MDRQRPGDVTQPRRHATRRRGLLHVLVPGHATTRAEDPPPGLSAQPIGSLALHGGQPLRLRVRCHRGPCIVRAAATVYALDRLSDNPSLVDGSLDLPRGRAGVLTLDPAAGDTLARAHDAPVQISLLACTQAGTRAAHLSLHLRLHRLPLPAPRLLDLVARRHGNQIDVTWRTSIPARDTTFGVVAQPVDLTHIVYAQIVGHGRSRFSIALHPPSSIHEHAVSVQVSTGDHPYNSPVTTRIR